MLMQIDCGHRFADPVSETPRLLLLEVRFACPLFSMAVHSVEGRPIQNPKPKESEKSSDRA